MLLQQVVQHFTGVSYLIQTIKRLCIEEQGQGMAEYGLILALIAIVVIGALSLLGEGISDKIEAVKDELIKDRTTPTT